ncbi:hypothetical protein BKA70DRAFT_1370124 [Coprinopsis sp. MPI-PUGE-AT-0042]|nr:hypothetical protein BKA70DRAFT_1370124 [Coprinopsis sp. MPI-PUGE-AT-0042]
MSSAQPQDHLELSPETVPLRTGPPTKEELLVYYPGRFTWRQLKTFVNSGDLGLLKRDRKLQKRYDDWSVGIAQEYGSMVKYLLNYRLRWGQPDTLSLLKSEVVEQLQLDSGTPTPYFSVSARPEDFCIIQNDWPYSTPSDVEHTVIWTKVPIYHSDLVHKTIEDRVAQDGLCGFTGLSSPPPSPSELPSCISTLSEWAEEADLVKRAGSAVAEFVEKRWKDDVWETAWFVNPPRLQSIPHLAHFHVFARKHGKHGV